MRVRARAGSVLSSLHSSALAQGYVKRRTCCYRLRQNPLEGCVSVLRRRMCSAGSCERFCGMGVGVGDPKKNRSGLNLIVLFATAN